MEDHLSDTSGQNSSKIILVTGATGNQGGAVAKSLLQANYKVRALSRNINSNAANNLKDKGAELVEGNMEDINSLNKAMEGVYGVFSVQNFWEKGIGYNGEILHAKNLIDAAKAAEVKHFIQASIAEAESAAGVKHFECKVVIEDYLKQSGLPATYIREVFFMDNFIDPKFGKNIFPLLAGTLKKDTKFHMVAVEDIGGLVASIFNDPENFFGKKVNVAGDVLTVEEMKSIYTEVTGKKPRSFKIPGLLLRLMNSDMHRQLVWNKNVGWTFKVEETKAVYPGVTDFRTFISKHQPQNL